MGGINNALLCVLQNFFACIITSSSHVILSFNNLLLFEVDVDVGVDVDVDVEVEFEVEVEVEP